MGPNSKKARSWDDIDETVQDKLLTLRAKEKELKDRSGYNKWLSNFSIGSLVYAFAYYNIYFRKQINKQLNIKVLFQLGIPIVMLGYGLMKVYYDKEIFKQYYDTHLELNRLIKKTSKSSEYK